MAVVFMLMIKHWLFYYWNQNCSDDSLKRANDDEYTFSTFSCNIYPNYKAYSFWITNKMGYAQALKYCLMAIIEQGMW